MADCVGCGFECRRGPCGYGSHKMQEEGKTWDPKIGCPYLRQVGIQWRCGIYLDAGPELKAEMEGVTGIGVGAGCSASLFNSDREKMILRLSALRASSKISSETP
jgi:hypothetical protein